MQKLKFDWSDAVLSKDFVQATSAATASTTSTLELAETNIRIFNNL